MTITTNTQDRKQMVNEISEHLNVPAVYLRTPTYAFQIGKLTVNRDASISAEDAADLEAIRPFLIEKGYIEPDAAIIEEDATEAPEPAEEPEQATTEETEAPDSKAEAERNDSEVSCLAIGFPYEDKTPAMLRNLIYILYSKQTLLNHSTGNNSLRVSDSVIAELKETLPETTGDFATLMAGFAETGELQGIEFKDCKVFISYGLLYDADWYNTFLHLTQKIFEAATTATRVFPEHQRPESEKYVMRSWLVRLGMGTPEYKAIRQLILKNLTGHSAFPSEEAAQKHREKYAQIRKERREAGEEHAE